MPAVYLAMWMDALRAVRKTAVSLERRLPGTKRTETERSLATDILADYAADQPQVLAELVMDADEKQFAVLYSRAQDRGERGPSAC